MVAFGGHDSGFPGDLAGASNGEGFYQIKKIFVGTYPKVFASKPGFGMVVVPSLTIGQGENIQNFALRRDWAALGGGGQITAFNGPDYTDFGCGPTGAIDQSLGIGWGSDSDRSGLQPDAATPKFIVIKLPQRSTSPSSRSIRARPAATAGSASTQDFRSRRRPTASTSSRRTRACSGPRTAAT